MSVSCECCQVEVSASGRSLVQRSPIECGVSECDRKAPVKEGRDTESVLSAKRGEVCESHEVRW